MDARRLKIAMATATATLAGLAIAVTPAPAATGPTPVLSSFAVPRTVVGQQGHARFLVGLRISRPARVVVRLTLVSNHHLVKTVTTGGIHKAGRVFLLIQATDNQGYQLPPAAYSVFVGATGPGGRNAHARTFPVQMSYTAPRGILDWFTIPNGTTVRSSLGLRTSTGQVVVAVHPGGPLARAGVARGDVIQSINGIDVGSPGGFARATRLLPANTAVPIGLLRGATPITATATLQPDWYTVSNLLSPVGQASATGRFAYNVALVDYDISIGRLNQATTIIRSWKGADGASTIAQQARAQLAVAQHQQQSALTLWTRALSADGGQSLAAFGQGLALDVLHNDPAAANAFAHAALIDPTSASAPAYQALALEQSHLPFLASGPASAALTIDPTDPNALAATGIARIQTGQRAAGITDLEHGITVTDDPGRAQLLISTFLEPSLP
jgi:hypothetical protein